MLFCVSLVGWRACVSILLNITQKFPQQAQSEVLAAFRYFGVVVQVPFPVCIKYLFPTISSTLPIQTFTDMRAMVVNQCRRNKSLCVTLDNGCVIIEMHGLEKKFRNTWA